MKKPVFYYGTIKRLIVIFGSLFNEVYYENNNKEIVKVPLFFAQREKFLVKRTEAQDMYRLNEDKTYPRMAFDLTGLNYAPERQTNAMNKIKAIENNKKYQYNRISYDFTFNLYITTKYLEQSLKIVEQILPLFSPSFNVLVNEVDGFDTETDIPIILNSVSQSIDYEGPFDGQRDIVWTLNFTVKAFLYNDTKTSEVIKTAIATLSPNQYDIMFEQYIASVIPKDAEKHDPHVIKEEITEVIR